MYWNTDIFVEDWWPWVVCNFNCMSHGVLSSLYFSYIVFFFQSSWLPPLFFPQFFFLYWFSTVLVFRKNGRGMIRFFPKQSLGNKFYSRKGKAEVMDFLYRNLKSVLCVNFTLCVSKWLSILETWFQLTSFFSFFFFLKTCCTKS